MAETEFDTADLDDELPIEALVTYRLLNLTSRLNRQGMKILQDSCGLRLPEWRCLTMIGRREGLALHDISDVIGMDRGQVTRAVQSLTEKGLVRTSRPSADRRVSEARLTRPGRKLYARVLPLMMQRQRRLLEALSAADRIAFYRITDRLMHSVEAWQAERRNDETS